MEHKDKDRLRELLRIALEPLDLPPYRVQRLWKSDLVWLAANMSVGNLEKPEFQRAVYALRRVNPGCYIVGVSEPVHA